MAFVTSNAMRLIRLHLSDGTGYDEDHAQLVFLKTTTEQLDSVSQPGLVGSLQECAPRTWALLT